ncbi:MAG: hypothetical protein J6Y29_02245 [Clostridiales bacterium]|nr:hypothetical protein [Clostridiales bacterium]
MKKCKVDFYTIVGLLPVTTLAELCGISKQYCHKLLKTNSKQDIFKKYCVLDGINTLDFMVD